MSLSPLSHEELTNQLQNPNFGATIVAMGALLGKERLSVAAMHRIVNPRPGSPGLWMSDVVGIRRGRECYELPYAPTTTQQGHTVSGATHRTAVLMMHTHLDDRHGLPNGHDIIEWEQPWRDGVITGILRAEGHLSLFRGSDTEYEPQYLQTLPEEDAQPDEVQGALNRAGVRWATVSFAAGGLLVPETLEGVGQLFA